MYVKIGNAEILAIEKVEIAENMNTMFMVGTLSFLVVVGILVAVVARKRHFKRKAKEKQKEAEALLHAKTVNTEIEAGMRELVKTMGHHGDSPFHTLPSDQAQGCLPFRHYQSFVLHVMFPPSHKDAEGFHQRLQCNSSSTLSSHRGTLERNGNTQMNSFLSVLGMREFILVFVRTLEKQPKFTVTDRNNVAAFIMIALQDRLDYATGKFYWHPSYAI